MTLLSAGIGIGIGFAGGAAAIAISYVSAGGMTAGAANPTAAYPASPVSGDMLVMCVASRDSANSLPTPSGWTAVTASTGGVGADGVDSGPVRLSLFYKISDGTESGSLVITDTTTAFVAEIRLYRKTGGTWSVDNRSGNTADEPAVTAWTASSSTWTVAVNDLIVVASAINGNVNTDAPTSPAYSTGAVFSAFLNGTFLSTSLGNDLALFDGDAVITQAVTNGPSHTATYATASGNTPSGTTVFLRLRAA